MSLNKKTLHFDPSRRGVHHEPIQNVSHACLLRNTEALDSILADRHIDEKSLDLGNRTAKNLCKIELIFLLLVEQPPPLSREVADQFTSVMTVQWRSPWWCNLTPLCTSVIPAGIRQCQIFALWCPLRWRWIEGYCAAILAAWLEILEVVVFREIVIVLGPTPNPYSNERAIQN